MLSSAIVLLTLAASALATVFITNPVASSSLTAGQPASLTWQDDGSSPSLSQWGNATFAILVGNVNQQTVLQTIATYINVSAVSSVQFTPNATIGPDSNEYFVRAISLSYTDPSSQHYVEAFSAKFTLSSMTGTFNSSVQAEINGQSTAPIGGPTTANAATTAQTATASASKPATPATSATAKSTNGAGKPAITTGFVALAAALVGSSLF